MDGTRRDGVVITGWRKRFCTRECLAWNKLPKAVVVALRTVQSMPLDLEFGFEWSCVGTGLDSVIFVGPLQLVVFSDSRIPMERQGLQPKLHIPA